MQARFYCEQISADRIRYLAYWLPLAAALCACSSTVTIDSMHPRPAIDLPQQGRSLRLSMDPSIAERYHLAGEHGFPAVDVHEWRRALTQAFVHGFGSHFSRAQDDSALTLHLAEVRLAWVAEHAPEASATSPMGGARAILVHGTPSPSGPAARPTRTLRYAQIRYRAELRDVHGDIVGGTSGVVTASQSTDGSRATVQGAVEEAVQAMYEAIAAQLFRRNTAARHGGYRGW